MERQAFDLRTALLASDWSITGAAVLRDTLYLGTDDGGLRKFRLRRRTCAVVPLSHSPHAWVRFPCPHKGSDVWSIAC